MKLIPFLVIVAFSITLTTNSQAQKAWTLEDCINHAIENNITVKRQELNADAAQKTHFQSKMELLPTINASGQHYYNSGKTLDFETYQYTDQNFQGGNVNLNSELTLFSGLQNLNSIKKSKYDLMARLEDVEKAKNDISVNVATAYLQILLNEELKINAQQQLEITLDQIEKTKKLVEIGNAAKGDLLQIEAQAATEKATLTNASNNLLISYLDLAQLLNLLETEDFKIAFPVIPDITFANELSDVNSIYNDAVEILPEIKGAELAVKSSERNVAISKGAISPSISASYSYGSRYNELSRKQINSIPVEYPGGITQTSGDTVNLFANAPIYKDNYPYLDQIGDNASHNIFISLRIPIFNRWRTKTSIEQAKIGLYDSKLNLDLQKQNLYKGIQLVRVQAIASKERYSANLEAVKSMAEAFRYTEQKYQVGLVDILEYNTSKNLLNKANSDLAQAKYEYIFRTKILDFYRGEQITL